MADITWIKLQTDMFDNRKIKHIMGLQEGVEIVIIWIKLLCLAGKINDDGVIYLTPEIPYTDESLADVIDSSPHIVKLALTTLTRLRMIDITDGFIFISSWLKYQNIEGMEKVREDNKLRQQRYRERKKKEILSTVTLPSRNSNVTSRDCNGIDKKRVETDIEKEKKKVFHRPDVQEVQAYIIEKDYHFSAEDFVAFYDSNGWMVGKNSMKDWRAACRTWESNNKNQTKTNRSFIGVTDL